MTVNPFDILKNARLFQEQMEIVQEKLGGITVTGASGGGMVEVDLNGRMEVLAVRISPDILNPPDARLLQDLTAAAFHSAVNAIKERIKQELGAMAGGMGLSGVPGLFG